MKKNLWVALILIVVVLGLFACAPAQAPTEVPATEYPSDVLSTPEASVVESAEPTPVPGQVTGTIEVRFVMADGLPEGVLNIDLPQTKTLEFKKVGNEWNKVGLIYPVTNPVDMGPLFRIEWSEPEFSANSGPVNAYYGEPEGGNSFWPLGETIPEEVTITIRLSYTGCSETPDKWLECEITTEDGSLKYWLNPEQDKFIYVMKGNYRLEYENWMVESLTKLGFAEVASKIPEVIIPGAKNTISK